MSFPVNSSLPRRFKRSWGQGSKGDARASDALRPCREGGSGDSAMAGHGLPHLQLISPFQQVLTAAGPSGRSHKTWLSLGEGCEPDAPWPCSPQPGLAGSQSPLG